MKAWWLGLKERERRMLLVGGIAIAVLMAYQLVYSPLTNTITQLRASLLSEQSLLTWMKQAEQQFIVNPIAANSTQTSNSSSILMRIENRLTQNNLNQYVQQANQPEDDQVKITLQKIPFDKFINWTQQITVHDAVSVAAATISATGTSGLVNVVLILKKR